MGTTLAEEAGAATLPHWSASPRRPSWRRAHRQRSAPDAVRRWSRPRCAACSWQSRTKVLNEAPTRATHGGALEAANREPQADHLATPGKVKGSRHILVMDLSRGCGKPAVCADSAPTRTK